MDLHTLIAYTNICYNKVEVWKSYFRLDGANRMCIIAYLFGNTIFYLWYLFIFSSSSMHCFEGPDWFQLKRGRECFPRGPLVKVDPLGRCAVVLVHGLQMIVLKAAEVWLLICLNFVTFFNMIFFYWEHVNYIFARNRLVQWGWWTFYPCELLARLKFACCCLQALTVYIGPSLLNLLVKLDVRLALV